MTSQTTSPNNDDVTHRHVTTQLQNEDKYQGISSFIGGVEMMLGIGFLLMGVVAAIILVLYNVGEDIAYSAVAAFFGLVLIGCGALKRWKNNTRRKAAINMGLSVAAAIMIGIFFGILTRNIATAEETAGTYLLALTGVSAITMVIELSHAGYFVKILRSFRPKQPKMYYNPHMRDSYFQAEKGVKDKTYFTTSIPTGFTFVPEKTDRISTIARRFSRFVPDNGASVHFSSNYHRRPALELISTPHVISTPSAVSTTHIITPAPDPKYGKGAPTGDAEIYATAEDIDLPDPPSEILNDLHEEISPPGGEQVIYDNVDRTSEPDELPIPKLKVRFGEDKELMAPVAADTTDSIVKHGEISNIRPGEISMPLDISSDHDDESSLPEAETVMGHIPPEELQAAINDAIKSLGHKEIHKTPPNDTAEIQSTTSQQEKARSPTKFGYNGDNFELVVHEVTDLTHGEAEEISQKKISMKLTHIRDKFHYKLIAHRLRALIPPSRSFITVWLSIEIDAQTKDVKLPNGEPAPYLQWFPTCPLKKSEYTKVGLYVSKSPTSSYQGMFNSPPSDIKHGALYEI